MPAVTHRLVAAAAAAARAPRPALAARLAARTPPTTTTTTTTTTTSTTATTQARAYSSSTIPSIRCTTTQTRRALSQSSQRRAADSAADQATTAAPAPSPPSTLYGYFPTTLAAGPPPSGAFAIDVPALRREFLRLQSAAHPDKQPTGRKAAAEAASAALNHAYRTLADPLLRAQYLLGLRGVDVAADEALRLRDSPASAGGDRELLMVVLDAHEVIEEAEAPAHLEPLRCENDERIRASHDALAAAFAADDVAAAEREAVRLRYWVNIRTAIHEWEEGKPPVLQH